MSLRRWSRRAKILKALESHPDREAIKRAHDLQLVHEYWGEELYDKWRKRFFENGEAYRFDHLLAVRRDPAEKCWPEGALPSYESRCGHVPDWRNAAMMAETKDLHEKNAAGHARWKATTAEEWPSMKERPWPHTPTVAEDYFDYEYAKRAWLTFQTRDELEREKQKYWTPFEAWVKTHTYRKKVGASYENETKPVFGREAALKALETHPDREAIKRAHDIQLALEHWMDLIYRDWRHRFSLGGSAYWFEHLLAMRHDPAGECWREESFPKYLGCGHIPDWRDAAMVAETKDLHERKAASHDRWLAQQERQEKDARIMRHILREPDPEAALKRYLANPEQYLKEKHGR